VSSSDLTDPNVGVSLAVTAAICGGCFGSLFFLFCESHNEYIRFYAWQSFLLSLPFFILETICYAAGTDGGIVFGSIFSVIHFCLVCILCYYGYQGARTGVLFKFPVIGDVAESQKGSPAFLPPPHAMPGAYQAA
jgi:uncharacterized membrane protein